MGHVGKALLVLACLSLSVKAHTFWLRSLPDGTELLLGHDQISDSYERSTLSELKAYDAQGQTIAFEESAPHGLLVMRNAQACAFSLKADYGTWIKTIHGWRQGSKQETQDRVLKSMWSVFYCKLVRATGSALRLDLPIEIVLISHRDDRLEGMLLWQGQPRTDCPIFQEHTQVAKTDSSGHFTVSWPKETSLSLSASVEEKLENHPRADIKTTVGSVTFEQ